MGTKKLMTRECWLNSAASILTEMFEESGHKIPAKIRYTVSLPSKGGMGTKRKVIGQCFYPVCSSSGTTEIFITPMIDDTRLVVGTLLHEMVHASLGQGYGHKKEFIALCKDVGCDEGKPTEACINDNTWNYLQNHKAFKRLGNFPHEKMKDMVMKKKDTVRNKKYCCPEHSEMFVRMSVKKFEDAELLTAGGWKCPVCETPLVEAPKKA
jgi:hypothetical protein